MLPPGGLKFATSWSAVGCASSWATDAYKNAQWVANSVQPEYTPRSVSSDIELHCLSVLILKLNTVRLIRKTYLYNFDPLKPHLYIVKLVFTGVYIILLVSAQNIDCGYSLEPPRWGGSNEYPQSMFWAEIWKISEFFIWKFSFFGGIIFSVFE